jgi:hypothetical protein
VALYVVQMKTRQTAFSLAAPLAFSSFDISILVILDPLSKNFLSFHSIIKAVREIDRDLLEAATTSMFLSNQASRERSDKHIIRIWVAGESFSVLLELAS